MSSQQTFMELCLAGKVCSDNIDDFIERWHANPGESELHDYLGMTEEEYALWLRVPDALPYIIKARREMQPLTDAVVHGYRDLRHAARSDDQSKIARLRQWLKAKGEAI